MVYLARVVGPGIDRHHPKTLDLRKMAKGLLFNFFFTSSGMDSFLYAYH
jgi:hypothetical protein